MVDLKSIHQLIGAASRVSFGKPEKLMEYLGVIPGSVTVLARPMTRTIGCRSFLMPVS